MEDPLLNVQRLKEPRKYRVSPKFLQTQGPLFQLARLVAELKNAFPSTVFESIGTSVQVMLPSHPLE